MDDGLTPTRPTAFSQEGLSLIEILVSIVLLSLVGIAFALSLGTGQEEIVDDGYRRMALTLTEEKMEELKALKYDDPHLATDALHQDPVTLDDRGTVDIADDLTGTRSWTVTEIAGNNSYKRIALTLAWSAGGQTHTVALDTFVAQR